MRSRTWQVPAEGCGDMGGSVSGLSPSSWGLSADLRHSRHAEALLWSLPLPPRGSVHLCLCSNAPFSGEHQYCWIRGYFSDLIVTQDISDDYYQIRSHSEVPGG